MIGAKGVELDGMASMLQWKGFLPKNVIARVDMLGRDWLVRPRATGSDPCVDPTCICNTTCVRTRSQRARLRPANKYIHTYLSLIHI